MPKIVPVKNIDPVLVDIKKPGGGEYRLRPFQINLNTVSAQPVIIYRPPKFRLVFLTPFLVLLIGLMLIFSLSNYYSLKFILETKIQRIVSNFMITLRYFKELQPAQAASQLKENNNLLADLQEILNKYGGQKIMETLGIFSSDFKEVSHLFKQVQELNNLMLTTSETLNDLKINGFYYFQNDGLKLISKLKQLKFLVTTGVQKLEKIQQSQSALKNILSAFNIKGLENLINQQYISHNLELYRWEKLLDGLIAFLDRKEDIHFLVLFQNPSEIRPGGGFIGSYADLVIRNGQLYSIDVRDIYDADGQLDLKVVPPLPLQATNYIWSARDANWFFDFPTSAAKVLYFLENSKIYQEKGIKFEAVAAININVLKNILGLIGPIPLKDYDLVIDENNFLKEIQREVEAGKDKIAGYPKRILRVLTPIILERIKNLNQDEKEKIVEIILDNLEQKDMMLFTKNKELQEFFVSQNIGGAVYELPFNFFGTYLAVVNANIEGGKSDTFVEQELKLDISLDTNGGSFNNLIIKRTHQGDKEKELWWRKTNQNYIQIFTNPQSSLVFVKGNNKAPSKFREMNYETLGYSYDPDVKQWEEKTIFLNQYQTWFSEIFGKKVFGTWFNVPAGQSKELEVRYQIHPQINENVTVGKVYQFIYEKQSGVNSKLTVKITAPYGYIWAESQTPIYVYESENPPARLMINLTLAK